MTGLFASARDAEGAIDEFAADGGIDILINNAIIPVRHILLTQTFEHVPGEAADSIELLSCSIRHPCRRSARRCSR